MLSLDDPRWRELQDAYGSAADVPKLLGALASSTGPAADHENEPWQSLWSRLCHQGEAFTASYAAVPHIVGIANSARGPIDHSFFTLPAAIEIARVTGMGPDILQADADDYHRAIGLLMENAALHAKHASSHMMILALATAQAVAGGHMDLAEALLNLDDDWIAKIRDDDRD